MNSYHTLLGAVFSLLWVSITQDEGKIHIFSSKPDDSRSKMYYRLKYKLTIILILQNQYGTLLHLF